MRSRAIAVALVIGASLAAPAAAQAPQLSCFDAELWAPAPDGQRPCARITRVLEDGSFRAIVYSANGKIRYRASVGAKDR